MVRRVDDSQSPHLWDMFGRTEGGAKERQPGRTRRRSIWNGRSPWTLAINLLELFDGALLQMPARLDIAVTPSSRTLHAELLRLCARIGYSPPAFSDEFVPASPD